MRGGISFCGGIIIAGKRGERKKGERGEGVYSVIWMDEQFRHRDPIYFSRRTLKQQEERFQVHFWYD